MKVAITGASGFLGSHVLEQLQTHDIDIVDVRRDGSRKAIEHRRTTRVQMDLTDAKGAFAAMGKPDLLIHLAWGGLPNYQHSRHLDVELPLQIKFLHSCADQGLRRLAVAGTCFEYGLQHGELVEEATAQPVTQYGLAKARLHASIATLADRGLIELDWARFFYLYGRGQAAASLYSQLMLAIDRGATVFDMSGGEQLRDFLPAAEAARLFVDVALAPGGAGAVNICSGAPISVSALVGRWVASRGAVIRLNKGCFPYSPHEPMAFWGSRTKLDAIINQPTSFLR